ncbi:MAG: transglutaminase-like domain-containing protein [Clostridia bacterium]|nr:transglutaminase-like domain-containing protein [Clostridia bacterium]
MTYIHPYDKRIEGFINNNISDRSDIKSVSNDLLAWFDNNIEYSRLNAPFFPLQRSDLDVLSMRSGTCGDYANLIVSVLLKLGYEAMYAYVHKDCYGDKQDHICAAVRDGEKWILIDATQLYRKWYGIHCPHQEYELIFPTAFEEMMKKEESYWINRAKQYGNELYAGLLYAPWIYERILKQTDTIIESIFYLMMIDEHRVTTVYAYYRIYTKDNGSIPMMSIISKGKRKYCFSVRRTNQIWDNEQ